MAPAAERVGVREDVPGGLLFVEWIRRRGRGNHDGAHLEAAQSEGEYPQCLTSTGDKCRVRWCGGSSKESFGQRSGRLFGLGSKITFWGSQGGVL